MISQAMGANALTTIQAKHILFVLLCILVNYAGVEEFLRQQGREPPRNLRSIHLQKENQIRNRDREREREGMRERKREDPTISCISLGLRFG